jgi:hypothetical protein
MAQTMGSLMPLYASIDVIFDFGVSLPARSPIRRATLLSCLLPHRLCHKTLLLMLPKTAEAAADDAYEQQVTWVYIPGTKPMKE